MKTLFSVNMVQDIMIWVKIILILPLVTIQVNAGYDNQFSAVDLFELVKGFSNGTMEIPPYDPLKYCNCAAPPAERVVVTVPEVVQKPIYYNPKCDTNKWKKCCKLDRAKECCMKRAAGLPLYNLGTGLYYFHTDMSNPKNWYDALHFCRARGMELASIESPAENNMLKAYAQWFLSFLPIANQADFYSFFWTSLNDLGSEGNFNWAGTGFPATYFTWHLSGQPDGGVWENCGEIWQTPVGTVLWNERDCLSWKGRFICEMPKICYDIISTNYD